MTDNDANNTNLAFEPATKLHEMIAEKEISPVELTRLYLDRIEKLNPVLNAYLTVDPDRALDAARQAEEAVTRGDELGPLHGVPISIKDLQITKGLRTTGGSAIFKNRVPKEDSIAVERIRAAGAIILGKTNTPEFGLLGVTVNKLGEGTRNPWNPDRTTGGSSGGAAAATVAGLCALAEGSDGGGSIRIPSSFCGIFGIKPTQGRVPKYSGANIAPAANHFSQAGPMTRTVRDDAVLFQVMAGHDGRDPSSIREPVPNLVSALDRDAKGLSVGWSPDYGYSPVDPEVSRVCREALVGLSEAGSTVADSDLALDNPFEPFHTLFGAMAFTAYGSLLDSDLTDYARNMIEHGATVSGADYALALGHMDRIRASIEEQLDRFDVVASPTLSVPAFKAGGPLDTVTEIDGQEVDPWWGYFPFTFPINMAGLPAVSIPAGFSAEGLPIGLQLVGKRGAEETLITLAAALERTRPWAQHRPQVS